MEEKIYQTWLIFNSKLFTKIGEYWWSKNRDYFGDRIVTKHGENSNNINPIFSPNSVIIGDSTKISDFSEFGDGKNVV